ncbi:ATP-binding cassette sub-family C member 4-like [Coccinella septempunctata]|uniref:ATP-binding cassette sub-family C member 4-like n=1 Tax=Coccinella septempunctata TaxID=41139 RepID=UPI001D0854A0|nr:ATP-binding cassette sub-family C member 4-like [Coccinella septempunctata]
MDESFPLETTNPEISASLFSKLCFLWTSECIIKCNKKEIKLKEIYRCAESHSSSINGNYLEEKWKEETKICCKRSSKPSLLKILMKVFYTEYCPLAITAFFNYVVIKGLQPLMLSNLIRLFINKNYTAMEILFYGGGLSLLLLCSSFLLHHTVRGSNLLAIKIRIAVSSLIYRKILRLNQESLWTTSSGQVINLLSNDVGRFETAIQAFHFLWMTPIQLAVIIFVIWNLFGLGALLGISCLLIIMIPLQGLLGYLTGVYRGKAAEKTDLRVKLMNEIFSGMEFIKMYTWEIAFEKLVQNIRLEELRFIRKTSFIRGILACMMFVTERLGLCVTVVCYSLLGFPVSTDVVFSVSICFRILQYSLGTMLPAAITIGSEVLVSTRRLEEFLLLKEIDSSKTKAENIAKGEVLLKSVSALWEEKKTALDDVSISISPGCLCGIVGPVGSGKSSLLKLLLGELPISKGSVKIKGTVSYTSQKPWLFSGTIRRNIIFDQEMDETRYRRVVEACSLTEDFEQLQYGDQTIVGSRGVALSGGQRARINLARAVYREADIYLLDDILSALDTKVGKYIFEECVLKFLEGKTRVLVTHQLHYLMNVEHIVILEKGYVEEQGTFTDIFKTKLETYFKEDVVRKNSYVEENEGLAMERKNLTEEENVSKVEDIVNLKGSMIWKYISFSGHMTNVAIFLVLLLLSQLSMNLSDYWLTLWSEEEYIRLSASHQYPKHSVNGIRSNISNMGNRKSPSFLYSTKDSTFSQWTDTVFVDDDSFILLKTSAVRTLYIIIILLAIIFMLLRSTLFFHLCIKASQKLHDKMFSSLLNAPLMLLQNTSPGNILNRFSKDMGAADELFPKALLNVLASIPILLGSMFLIVISNSLMLILIIPLVLMMLKIRKWFLITVKTLRRIETAMKSPVFSYVTSTFDGVTTIRATKCEELLIPQFDRHQDVHTACSYLAISCTSAFGLWLDLLCVSFVSCVILLFVILDRYTYISGSFIGLAIFHSMTTVGLFQFCIRTLSETVNYLTNIERILDYTNMEKEEDTKSNDHFPPRLWPNSGEIEFRNLNFRYSEEGKLVLQNMNLKILGSEKVGIVGRTGAGKSSIITVLFRLAQIEGKIFIDGVDIEDIALKKLRREIAVIPQEPVLFSASVRFNIDPYFEFPDERIWKILGEWATKYRHSIFMVSQQSFYADFYRRTHPLKSRDIFSQVGLQKVIPSLDFPLTEGGNNLSTGQRQLLCLVRAMLRDNKILILDEATANVDTRTDEVIQEIIKKKFHSATVITVAHRLNSVMNSDRILVMRDGVAVEFDHPLVLLQKEKGYFKNLLEGSGSEFAESSDKLTWKS